jgi:hypothetical protein
MIARRIDSETVSTKDLGPCALNCGGQIQRITKKITDPVSRSCQCESSQHCTTEDCIGVIPHNKRLDSPAGIDQTPPKYLDLEDESSNREGIWDQER